MHNTLIKNLEFKIAFTETNLRWKLGEVPQNPESITRTVAQIESAKKELLLASKGN